ncbi:MAG: GTP-binding protein [Candidatus Rokubacteria bacterium]|nr:GTP-binding protein [Candidatus Rokubacteria bacterium]
MNEVPVSGAGRHLRDGGFAFVLLALAISTGYALLSPAALRATPLPPDRAALAMVPPVTGPRPGQERVLPDRHPVSPEPAPAAGPVEGRVLAPGGGPLAGASIVVDGVERRADLDGRFTIEQLAPDTPVLLKMPGYERASVRHVGGRLEVVLKPHAVKAAYLTYFGVGDKAIRGRVFELLARTELNAVVIDVKGDRGWIPYRTEVELARAAGARGPVLLRDVEGMLAGLKARGVYAIARIVVMKDNVLALHRPDLAVIDTRTGKPWVDNEKLAWVDPFQEEVWDYNIAIAREAVSKGFDEVQFDYVRFPTDGRLGVARYAKPNTKDTRLGAIAGFLARARRELGPLGAFVAAAVFGYTAFNENDTDIGQRVEELAPHVDYICPMVYPSGYHVGIPGYRNPVTHPYEVVRESVRLIRRRSSHAATMVRPWLQDFRDYAFDRRAFGPAEIRAQIKGATDAGAAGWMLWNPRNDYTGAALRPKGPIAAK